ncbi:MAG TPA: YceI family protein [Candidatus Limnocylindrales bacterium]|nr:YceI family protein [Candidatus Limnocylindrales bacterium]
MAVTTWNIDTAHTDVLFSAKHMMVTTVRGKFGDVSGTITLDEENPTASSGQLTVAVASLNTGAEQRDAHLRSADFFAADNHPNASFTTTDVAARGGNAYAVTGDLTIRGTTRPVTFDVELLGFYTGMNGARRAGFHATGKINREDFGLNWNVALETGGWLVGKDIKLEFDLAIEQAEAVTAERGTRAA